MAAESPNVPGILMKSERTVPRHPAGGLAVKVTDGFFLVGLSNVESGSGAQSSALERALMV